MKWYEIMKRKSGSKRRVFVERYSKEYNTPQEINAIIKHLNDLQDGCIYTIRIR